VYYATRIHERFFPLFRPSRGAVYCDDRVCARVCPYVCVQVIRLHVENHTAELHLIVLRPVWGATLDCYQVHTPKPTNIAERKNCRFVDDME